MLSRHPFDPRWNLNHHADLTTALGSGNVRGAYEHWIESGINEGRQSNANFSIAAYRDRQGGLKIQLSRRQVYSVLRLGLKRH